MKPATPFASIPAPRQAKALLAAQWLDEYLDASRPWSDPAEPWMAFRQACAAERSRRRHVDHAARNPLGLNDSSRALLADAGDEPNAPFLQFQRRFELLRDRVALLAGPPSSASLAQMLAADRVDHFLLGLLLPSMGIRADELASHALSTATARLVELFHPEDEAAARFAGRQARALGMELPLALAASHASPVGIAFALASGARDDPLEPAFPALCAAIHAQLREEDGSRGLLGPLARLSIMTSYGGEHPEPACAELLAQAGCSTLARDAQGRCAADMAADLRKDTWSAYAGPAPARGAGRDPVAEMLAHIDRLADKERVALACSPTARLAGKAKAL